MAIDPILTESYFKPIINAATGRVAFEIQAGKATVEAGNTGVRDLSGMFDAGQVASGRVLVQRVGNTVTWTVSSLRLNGTGNLAAIFPLIAAGTTSLAGFSLPTITTGTPLMANDSESARFMVHAVGGAEMHYAAGGVGYTGSFSFNTTAPWPTTLPGVANGQPVGV